MGPVIYTLFIQQIVDQGEGEFKMVLYLKDGGIQLVLRGMREVKAVNFLTLVSASD